MLLLLFISGGSPYSYCGNMEQSVCCYVPRGARPVGLLPVLNKSKCGRKGNNVPASSSSTGSHNNKRTDGLADLGEYPWHVSKRLASFFLFTSCFITTTVFIKDELMTTYPDRSNISTTNGPPSI
jgi:hypothetical protein